MRYSYGNSISSDVVQLFMGHYVSKYFTSINFFTAFDTKYYYMPQMTLFTLLNAGGKKKLYRRDMRFFFLSGCNVKRFVCNSMIHRNPSIIWRRANHRKMFKIRICILRVQQQRTWRSTHPISAIESISRSPIITQNTEA